MIEKLSEEENIRFEGENVVIGKKNFLKVAFLLDISRPSKYFFTAYFHYNSIIAYIYIKKKEKIIFV